MTISADQRFWSKVDKNPGHGPQGNCWIWTGSINWAGYGIVQRNRKRILTHRYALGNPPQKVLHKCDFPPCCRPRHLFLGTQGDNNRDMYSKGRGRGGFMRLTKLNKEEVIEIRSLAEFGIAYKEIADAYAICPSMVSRIKCGNRRASSQ